MTCHDLMCCHSYQRRAVEERFFSKNHYSLSCNTHTKIESLKQLSQAAGQTTLDDGRKERKKRKKRTTFTHSLFFFFSQQQQHTHTKSLCVTRWIDCHRPAAIKQVADIFVYIINACIRIYIYIQKTRRRLIGACQPELR